MSDKDAKIKRMEEASKNIAIKKVRTSKICRSNLTIMAALDWYDWCWKYGLNDESALR